VFEQYRRVWPLSFALDPGSFHWCSGIQPFQSGYRLLLGRLPSTICALKDSPAYWVKESVCDLVVELEVEACRQRGEFDLLTLVAEPAGSSCQDPGKWKDMLESSDIW
jgi:hypothetical protein